MTATVARQKKKGWELGVFTGLSLGFGTTISIFCLSGRPADTVDGVFAIAFFILAMILAVIFSRSLRGGEQA